MHKKEIIAITALAFFIIAMAFSSFSSQSITGNLIKEDERSNYFYGVYSFAPGFKVQTDLDFSIYDNIAKDMKSIIECVESGQSTDACVSNREFTKELQWEFDCDKGEERVFYDIAKLYDDCVKSPDTNCLCSLDLGKKDYLEKNKLTGTYTFKILQSTDAYSLSNEEETLTYALKGFSTSYIPLSSSYTYQNSKLDLEVLNQKENGRKDYLLSEFSGLMLLKQTKNGAVSLDPVGTYAKGLAYPGTVPVDFQGTNTNPPPCQKPKQSIERFCVTDPRKQYMVFDEKSQIALEKPITIKFAAHLPDTPPAPIQHIEVKDMPKASKSVIVSWDATTATDALFYKVYSGQSVTLQTTPTAQMNGKSSITTFQLSDVTSIQALPTLDTCTFNVLTKKCEFGNGAIIEKGKLYSTHTNGKTRLLTVISVPEDGELAHAVTAVDSSGNEIDNVKELQKLPVVSGTSVDDLPPLSEGIVPLLANLASFYDKDAKIVTFPSYTLPTSNIDGTLVTDFKDVAVYYKKTPQQTPTKTEKLEFFDGEIVPILQDGKLLITFSDAQQFDVYSFIVVARDTTNNPKKAHFTVEEIGASILELPIT